MKKYNVKVVYTTATIEEVLANSEQEAIEKVIEGIRSSIHVESTNVEVVDEDIDLEAMINRAEEMVKECECVTLGLYTYVTHDVTCCGGRDNETKTDRVETACWSEMWDEIELELEDGSLVCMSELSDEEKMDVCISIIG